jgi:hypothetical protein
MHDTPHLHRTRQTRYPGYAMEPLPFAVGASPFHAKGVNYQNFVAFVDAGVAGGLSSFAASLRDPALRAFVSQRFLAASWYDALPMTTLLRELGRELGTPPLQLGRELAQFGVKRDASGIYRLLLKFTTPESLLERSTNTARQYFDFVRSDFLRLGECRYRLTHAGIPAFAAPTYMSIVEGFIETGLRLAGAKDVRQHWDKPTPTGTAHGVPIVTLQREISWRQR